MTSFSKRKHVSKIITKLSYIKPRCYLILKSIVFDSNIKLSHDLISFQRGRKSFSVILPICKPMKKENISKKIKRISVLIKNATIIFARRRSTCIKPKDFQLFIITVKGLKRDTVQNVAEKILQKIVILSEEVRLFACVLVKIHRKIPVAESYYSKITGPKPLPLLH